jgi:hypothetical protein
MAMSSETCAKLTYVMNHLLEWYGEHYDPEVQVKAIQILMKMLQNRQFNAVYQPTRQVISKLNVTRLIKDTDQKQLCNQFITAVFRKNNPIYLNDMGLEGLDIEYFI